MSFPNVRTLIDHKVGPLDENLEVVSLDEPGSGGAHHMYAIGVKEARSRNPLRRNVVTLNEFTRIRFQNGPVTEKGVNGISMESLLTVCIDRLRRFQEGPFACESNANALSDLESAMKHLQDRTRERMARHVEGKSVA